MLKACDEHSPRHSPLLIGTGVFALLWTVARATVQSITIDEADSYLSNVLWSPTAHWDPRANNHVLNSMLMRLVTMIFGASAFTIRVPALFGAALYIGAAYCLVRLISGRRMLQ
jgi:ABC-type phosphate transport system permease subunit